MQNYLNRICLVFDITLLSKTYTSYIIFWVTFYCGQFSFPEPIYY